MKALWVRHCIVLVALTLMAISFEWCTRQCKLNLAYVFPSRLCLQYIDLQGAWHQWTCDMKKIRGSRTCSSHSRHQERILGPGRGSIVHQQVVRLQKGGREWNLRGLLCVGDFFVWSRMNLKFKPVEICLRVWDVNLRGRPLSTNIS